MAKDWNERSKKERQKYVDAMGKLYGDKVACDEVVAPVAPKKPKAKRKDCPLEEFEQIRLATWLHKNKILFTASANGELRHKTVAAKLKKMGVTPD